MPTIGTLTISNGAADSSNLQIPNVANYEKIAFLIPSAWTAADLKFQVSFDGGTTWVDVATAAAAVIKLTSIPTAQSILLYAPVDAGGNDYLAALFRAFPNAYFQVVSINTGTGADENQGAARTIKMFGVPPAVAQFGRAAADGGNIDR